jgi:hypothetical protein
VSSRLATFASGWVCIGGQCFPTRESCLDFGRWDFSLQNVGRKEDVDPHKLIQVAGPKVMLGKAMMTGDVAQISFATKGVYKFTTKTLEMPGMAEVETIGPDHNLQLTVDVA